MSSETASTATSREMVRLAAVVAALREHCPWTAALTPEALTTYLLEESHELIEALEGGNDKEISGELGDVLLQVVLHSRLAEEAGRFNFADVAAGLSAKLIRRSPHVFHADGTLQDAFPATLAEIEATWERVKAQERALASPGLGASDAAVAATPGTAAAVAAAESPYAGIPATLPALAMAQKTVERASRAGIALPTPAGLPGRSTPEGRLTEEELGEVLFDVVLEAHQRGLDAERALRRAVRRFQSC